jgi:hypothetical protein
MSSQLTRFVLAACLLLQTRTRDIRAQSICKRQRKYPSQLLLSNVYWFVSSYQDSSRNQLVEAAQSGLFIMAKINPLALVGLAVGLGIAVLFCFFKVLVRLRRAPRIENLMPPATHQDIEREAAFSTTSSMTLVEKRDSGSEWQRFGSKFENPDTFYKDLPKGATSFPKISMGAAVTRPEVAHLPTRQSRLSACLPFTALDYDDGESIPESPWG